MMLNFIQATKAMKKGERVRRKSWKNKDWFIHIKNGKLLDSSGLRRYYNIDSIEAIDWEVYKEYNWNCFEHGHEYIDSLYEDRPKKDTLRVLKEKLIVDIKKEYKKIPYEKNWGVEQDKILKVLDKRFGF